MNRHVRSVAAMMGRLPWWASGLLGLIAAVLGLLLLTRPLSALGVLGILLGLGAIASGIGDLTEERTRPDPMARVLGWGWVLLGAVVLLWLGRAVELLPTVVAVALMVSGVARWWGLRSEATVDGRISVALFGAADVVFGVLALSWPGVASIVLAVLFGARTMLFGIATLWRALWHRGSEPIARPTKATWLLRSRRTIGAALTMVVAAGAVLLFGRIDAASPSVDDFYSAPATVSDRPGVLLRSEPFRREVPAGAQAWRILYTTTGDDGAPALASALVVVPATGGDHPVIAWAHGTTGSLPVVRRAYWISRSPPAR